MSSYIVPSQRFFDKYTIKIPTFSRFHYIPPNFDQPPHDGYYLEEKCGHNLDKIKIGIKPYFLRSELFYDKYFRRTIINYYKKVLPVSFVKFTTTVKKRMLFITLYFKY